MPEGPKKVIFDPGIPLNDGDRAGRNCGDLLWERRRAGGADKQHSLRFVPGLLLLTAACIGKREDPIRLNLTPGGPSGMPGPVLTGELITSAVSGEFLYSASPQNRT